MSTPLRPFLLLVAPERQPFSPPTRPRPRLRGPNKERQVQRLEPQFAALREALAGKKAALQSDPSGVAPEYVLVIAVHGSARDFHETVARTPGLEWLADEDVRDLDPDTDFYNPSDPAKAMTARLYLVMSNQEALSQLLALHRLWRRNQPLGREHRAWSELFLRIRQIRRWDVQDRLQETGILEDWEERKRAGEETVPVEIELWFRSEARRSDAERRTRKLVQRLGGQVTHVSTIEAIAYHALCVHLPIQAVDRIASSGDVDLIKSDDIFLFRPVPQSHISRGDDEPHMDARSTRPAVDLGAPVVALLDGLPLENHQYLDGRLKVDDPDGWSETYHAAARMHGTAMASLILHGDLSAGDAPLSRKLYVRPIMQPDFSNVTERWSEQPPRDILWVDLVHRAVLRVVEGDDGAGPAAPTVCVFNLSIGDRHRPFVHSMSPMARLLDWLAWKYQVLFIVSAGNPRLDDLVLDGAAPASQQDIEIATIRQIYGRQRHMRLLSPAESINALTVGASHDDHAGPWQPHMDDDRLLVSTPGLPSPFSALGRGFRRAVKPDVLMPGGRLVFRKHITQPTRFYLPLRSPRLPPGQKVAAPNSAGDVRGTWFTFGTSNAAALASRLASRIHDQLQDALDESPQTVAMALWIKTLLVHAASWPPEAKQVLEQAIRNKDNQRRFRDEVTAFLGYGTIDADRALGCTDNRVTLLGGGAIQDGETWTYQVPVPTSLHAHTHWRRLTTTLAWFTPIHAGHRKYRSAALRLSVPQERDSILGVEPVAVDGLAVLRGTVQHQVFERQGRAMDVAEDSSIALSVSCTAEAGPLHAPVPYALAVTLEIAPDLLTSIRPIYDEIRERLRPGVRISTT
jgi:hypothetical protein